MFVYVTRQHAVVCVRGSGTADASGFKPFRDPNPPTTHLISDRAGASHRVSGVVRNPEKAGGHFRFWYIPTTSPFSYRSPLCVWTEFTPQPSTTTATMALVSSSGRRLDRNPL